VPASRIIAVVGRKGAGKSSLVEALASELMRRGRRVESVDARESADPMARARGLEADLVMVESTSAPQLPCIEVHRASAGAPLNDPDSPDADRWIAIVTDDPDLAASCRVFRFQDTMWLQFLAMLAWDRATIVR
jgi:molybdopterin-guanine dinucleotide biosynthesis protein